MPKPLPQISLQLHIELDEVRPAVWRRILVPTAVSLDRLADMLLAAMGWTNSHLHCFSIGDVRYGMQFDDYPDDELDEKGVTVLRALQDVKRFEFEYDFGDRWIHTVACEDRIPSPVGLKYAVCIDGANACPPEDCGGPDGFERFVEALADPAHPEHEMYVDWNDGAVFDRQGFDLVTVNAALQKVRLRGNSERY